MKQLMIYMFLIVPASVGFCQQQDPPLTESRDLKDIKTDKKIAWISLAVAATSFTTAAIIENQKGEDKMKALYYVGFTATLASVTFFNDANRKRKEAFPLSKSEHIQKSKTQKIAAWVLLGTGTVVLTIAGASAPGKGDSASLSPAGWIGFGLAATSIPFFISSAQHKRTAKTLAVSLKREQAPLLKGCMITKNDYPALSLQIRL